MKTAFINRCQNVFGSLSDDCRVRLEAVMRNPNQETWDDAYTLIISKGFGTLWQAWIAVDSNAPRSKPCDSEWPVVPDQLTIYRAIKHATGEKYEN